MKLKYSIDHSKGKKRYIGLKIQEFMDLHNLSLAKVASSTGLSSESIRQIINGTIKNPGIETLSKIAEAFSVNLFDLLETKNVTSHIKRKRIKIVDIFDLEKKRGRKITDLLNRSFESTEILYIEENELNFDFFAIEVNTLLAEKLTTCGMPILDKGDLLIFRTDGECSIHSIVLAKQNEEIMILGIIMEADGPFVWIKSVDIPQKQIIIKIKKTDIVGIVHNVQFSK